MSMQLILAWAVEGRSLDRINRIYRIKKGSCRGLQGQQL